MARGGAKSVDDDETTDDEIIEYPIDGVLDLHAFRPGEAADVVREYIRACRERGVLEVRIVHGKGRGQLRRTVHTALARMPEVAGFRLAGEDGGGWGATLVELKSGGG
jgi:DNA-nicking Smr family endonuclease